MIEDREWREFLGEGALAKSRTFTWTHSKSEFAEIVSCAGS